MSRYTEIVQKETPNYQVFFRFNTQSGQHEVHVKGKNIGRHFAVHTRFNLLDGHGHVIEKKPITPEVGRFILDHFEHRGDTESFNIQQSDLLANRLLSPGNVAVDLDTIKYSETTSELTFTATGAKLHHHWPIFRKLAETGYGSIIRATMTNTQVCSSNCQYCSTILRNRKDSITLEEAKAFIEKLYVFQGEFNRKIFPLYNELYKKQTGSDIRLRGLILSGGGQPNLWPHFYDFVTWLSDLDIDLGLITNGFPSKIDEEIYRRFKWIRISITPENASPFYKDGRFDRQYFPESIRNNPDITVGLSYVFGPWTDDDVLFRIHEAIHKNGFDYCRMLTDCNLTRQSQLLAHKELGDRLVRLGYMDEKGRPLTKMFHQLKYHGSKDEAEALWTDGQCFLQSYNVFWDTTGHEADGASSCYPCDSVTVLAEEQSDGSVSVSDRKFDAEKWGTVKNTEVERLFTEPIRPYFDPRSLCASCLFMKNNRVVRDLVENHGSLQLNSNNELGHINFP